MAKGPYVVQGLLVNGYGDVYQASGAVVGANEISKCFEVYSKIVFCLRSYGGHGDALLLQMCFCEDFWVSFYPYLRLLDVRHVDLAHIFYCPHEDYVAVRACLCNCASHLGGACCDVLHHDLVSVVPRCCLMIKNGCASSDDLGDLLQFVIEPSGNTLYPL
jgi:hypothetical protein